MRRPEWYAWCAAIIALLTAVARAGDAVEPREDWFIVSIAGSDCGWLHEQVRVDGERVVTRSHMCFALGRAGSSAVMEVGWDFEESPAGTPRVCSVRQRSGDARSSVRYRFVADQVEIEEQAGGRDIRRSIPLPPRPWLTPAEVERETQRARSGGKGQLAYRTIDPTAGLRVVDMTSSRESVAADGSSVWNTTNSALPIPSREELDASGRVVRSVTPLPVGEMVARRSTERAARAAAKGGAQLDLIGRSMVAVGSAGERLPRASRAVMSVGSVQGAPPMLESSGAQVAKAAAGGAVEVSVDASRSSEATAAEREDMGLLRASILIDSDEPAVRELASGILRAAGLSADAKESARAEALRAGVFRFITNKSMATAFAGASEVVRTKSGDCSEHAVLLAALLRAQGIRARVASGMVYADHFAGGDHVFVWHMWTQAMLDGRWHDLDATLDSRAFHPGHLLLATSVQDDAQLDADFSAIVAVIGNVKIEVLRVD
ncbi:MAG: transglutaminase-like domain-containing protein [Planctomycetota bacterium]